MLASGIYSLPIKGSHSNGIIERKLLTPPALSFAKSILIRPSWFLSNNLHLLKCRHKCLLDEQFFLRKVQYLVTRCLYDLVLISLFQLYSLSFFVKIKYNITSILFKISLKSNTWINLLIFLNIFFRAHRWTFGIVFKGRQNRLMIFQIFGHS